MHRSFGHSKLVRLLDAWTPVPSAAGGADIAEQASAWFGPLEAIRLQALNQSASADSRPARTTASGRAAQALAEDLQRVRGLLAKAIAQDPLALADVRAGDEDAGYAPWQQRHLDLQRQMAQMIDALRDHARQAVAQASPRLQPLAVLDEGLEQLFASRQQVLLPALPTLLERRYRQLKAAGQLADFGGNWRHALLAELDLRLEPVAGLLDALHNETEHTTT